jgi:regulator of sirC expression with transglutaminase-like and TPR domain
LNARDWKPVFGARWSQRAGRVQVEGAGQGFGGRSLCLSQKPVPERPYEIAVEVRLDDESGAAGLVFAADGGDRHYGFYPSAGQLRLTRFDGPSVYSWNILKQVPAEHYQPGEWNQIRVRVEAERILCFVNDQLVAESQDDGLKAGQVGLAKFRDTRAEFRNFRLGTNGILSASARAASATGTNAIALKERARSLEREAKELRREAAKLHRATVQGELLKALGEPEAKIDLFHAALLLARLDNAELDIEPYRQQITEMAREVTGKFSKDADAATKLAALKEYLFAENGFHGSRSDYSSRANSYINQVLDDREGLPITLSVLFMELAQRIGLSGVDGLPLPGHFMVRYTPGNGPEQIIDAYNGGRTVSRTEAQERVLEATGEGFRDFDFRSATKREIILRMLRNLLGGIRVDDAPVDSLRYLDAILALAPDGVSDRLNRARLRMQMGNSAGAKEDFKWLLDQQPAGVDLERVAELYRSL